MSRKLSDKLFHQYVQIMKVQMGLLGFNPPKDLSDEKTLIQIYNFEKKYISVKPRKVHQSTELNCPRHLTNQFATIKNEIETGKDLNQYQGINIGKFHKHDDLLYDWGIHHLHFDSLNDPNFNRKKRSKELLFIIFVRDDAYLIDIDNHDESFTNERLIEIINSNWNFLFEGLWMEGANGTPNNLTSEARKALRKNNINCNTTLKNGKVLMSMMLGGGFSSSGDNSFSSFQLINAKRSFDVISVFIEAINKKEVIVEDIKQMLIPNLLINDNFDIHFSDGSFTLLPFQTILNKAIYFQNKKFE